MSEGKVYTHKEITEILEESDMWEEKLGLAVDALEESSARLTREIERDGHGVHSTLPRDVVDVRNEIEFALKKIHGRE